MSYEIRDYKDLTLWQCAIDLCATVYEVVSCLPDWEKYELSSQLRRAAVSIPANIAEGYGRGSRQDYIRFLRVARGSACEVETELILAARLDLLDGGLVDRAFDELR